jgi:hypothetical protein
MHRTRARFLSLVAVATSVFSSGVGYAQGAPKSNQFWWPHQLNVEILHQHSSKADPMGEDFDYAAELRFPRPRRGGQGPARAADGPRRRGGRQTTATTARSSSAWPGTARAPTVSRRRPRRRRDRRAAALRAAQQLARQRQPRQGPSPAVAHQAEVRPQDLVGRPDGAHRQRGAGLHGVQDPRLRRRPTSGTTGSRTSFTGAPRRSGWAMSATPATASSPTRSAPCRWASST